MSRPFSYSDENFTVIGNVLFCHIKIKKAIPENEPIVEIPPEIYDRMLFFSQQFNMVQPYPNVYAANTIVVSVAANKPEYNNKYFLFTERPIYEKGLYLAGFFILKDI